VGDRGLDDAARARFDALLQEVIDELPTGVARLLEEVPVVVIDRPTDAMLRSLGVDPGDAGGEELFGLHSGPAITERSIEASGELPDEIHLFREGLIRGVGGVRRLERDPHAVESLRREIRVTLLHEIGHHMGLEEDDLFELGYD